MTSLAWLIPVALFLGGLGLAGFIWALKSGQFEDLEGAAYRALEDDPPKEPTRVDRFCETPALIGVKRRNRIRP